MINNPLYRATIAKAWLRNMAEEEKLVELRRRKRIPILKIQRGTIERKLSNFEKVLYAFEPKPDADFELLDIKGRLSKQAPL